MKITEVTLENIKSYEDRTTIPLQDGVTAILGENGSGKSTIQEAIGFALFDSLPFNNKAFVREGASSGTVEVTIVLDDRDGSEQTYRVTRSAGYSKYGVARYDAVSHEWVDQDIDSKKALVQWLCATFDVDDGDELSKLWESCVGVPQTRFLSDFAQTATNRQDTFDELLGIDAYEDSWKALKGVPDEISAERQRVREDIRELTGEVQSLPAERAEKEELEAEVEQIESKIESARTTLTDLEEQYEELEALSERIDELEDDIEQKTREIDAKEDALNDAETELEAAQEAANACDVAREGYETYVEAKDRQEELEAELQTLTSLRDDRQELHAERGRLETRQETLLEDVEKYENAEAELEAHEADNERYDEIEERLSELESDREHVERLQGDLSEFDAQARDDLSTLRETVNTISEIESEASETPDASEIRERIGDVNAEIKSLESEEADIREQLERLRDADAEEPCPTCGKPLEGEHRSKTIDEREARLDEIKAEVETLTDELSDLQQELDEAERVEARVAKLEMYSDQAESLRNDLKAASEKRRETLDQITSLEASIEQIPDLEAERESLEDAKEAYNTAQVRVGEYADAEENLKEVEASIDSLTSDIEQLDEEIDEYSAVEDELAEVKETLKEAEDDYQQFERNRQTADQLAERENAVEALETELDKLREEREELTQELENEQESFDDAEFEALSDDIDDTRGTIERLGGKLGAKKDSLDTVTATVNTLEAKLEERTDKIETLRELAADEQFADWVRTNVRAAGPKMRDVITDRIGKRADTIFRSIRGRKAEQLEWTSDYDIVVFDADVRKSFSTLSGGEKMAAALAVRLAILEQVSGLGVAFLDEPTANLDADKKANLVDQLNQLDAFEQLAVISHDSTFDTMTDYSVTIEKPDQTSQVMSD